MKVIILGGGPAGLGAAYKLAKRRVKTEVIEMAPKIGGLASAYNVKDYLIDKYYHIIYTTDNVFLEVLKELNLSDELEWKESEVGVFSERKIYKMSTPFDLLTFKPLNIFNRIKFGVMTLKSSYFQDLNKLKKMNAEQWLRKDWGNEIYEKIFQHLLRTKFGMSMDKASAAFVCGRIKARAQSRSGGKEKLGYFKGSFQTVFENMKKASDQTVKYHLNSKIKNVEKKNEDFVVEFEKEGKGEKIVGDYIINTLPMEVSLNLIKDLPLDYKKRMEKIKYQGVICVLMGLKKKLSNYYWINVLSEKIPFGVVVEHTNLKNEKCYDGDHLVYLAQYFNRENELWKKKDDEVIRIFLKALKGMFPEFERDDVLWIKVAKDAFATPLFTVDYAEIMPDVKTPLKGLYVAGNVRIYPNSRNMNNVIQSGFQAAEAVLKEMDGSD